MSGQDSMQSLVDVDAILRSGGVVTGEVLEAVAARGPVDTDGWVSGGRSVICLGGVCVDWATRYLGRGGEDVLLGPGTTESGALALTAFRRDPSAVNC